MAPCENSVMLDPQAGPRLFLMKFRAEKDTTQGTSSRPQWVWVKNSHTKWNPGKWNPKTSGFWWFDFDPSPNACDAEALRADGIRLKCASVGEAGKGLQVAPRSQRAASVDGLMLTGKDRFWSFWLMSTPDEAELLVDQ